MSLKMKEIVNIETDKHSVSLDLAGAKILINPNIKTVKTIFYYKHIFFHMYNETLTYD